MLPAHGLPQTRDVGAQAPAQCQGLPPCGMQNERRQCVLADARWNGRVTCSLAIKTTFSLFQFVKGADQDSTIQRREVPDLRRKLFDDGKEVAD